MPLRSVLDKIVNNNNFISQVKWVEQQRILERSKRDVIPGEDELVQRSVARLRRDTAVTIRDPFFKDQWYLVSNYVMPMWYQTITGQKWVQKCVYSGKNEDGLIKNVYFLPGA